jgi:hypothetical protein
MKVMSTRAARVFLHHSPWKFVELEVADWTLEFPACNGILRVHIFRDEVGLEPPRIFGTGLEHIDCKASLWIRPTSRRDRSNDCLWRSGARKLQIEDIAHHLPRANSMVFLAEEASLL